MPRRLQFSVRGLLVTAFAACIVVHISHILERGMAVGRISDLPIAERQSLAVIASHGIAVVDRFT